MSYARAGRAPHAGTVPTPERVDGRADLPAAVTLNSHITGLAVARSLGRRGVPVVALDSEWGGLGMHSRYVVDRGLVPRPETEGGAALAEALVARAPRHPGAVLVPTNDDWVVALARHRPALEAAGYRLPGAPLAVLERVVSKTELWRTCTRLGVPTPRSWPLADTDPATLTYPLVLKPDDSRGFYDAFRAKVWVVASPAELRERRAEAAGRGLTLLAQELIETPPGGFVSLASFLSADGMARGVLTGRKLEQWPAGFGTCCLADTRWHPDLAERGLRVLRELGYSGVSECEFVLDPRTGEHLLLDVNPRVWKWVGLCTAAGVDLPWLAYADALGRPETAPPPREGVRWVFLRDYLRLLRSRGAVVPEAAVSHDEWVALLSGRLPVDLVDGVHDPGDPEPAYDALWAELTGAPGAGGASGAAGPAYSCAC